MQRILIVDDNPTIMELVKFATYLQGKYQVSCASDGVQGYELVHALNPDLVILDDIMPKLKGRQLIQILRAEGNCVPILMLTARLSQGDESRDEEREVKCLELGCDDFVLKPIRPSRLNARIEALLRRRRDMFQRDTSGEVLKYADVEINTSEHIAFRGSYRLQLTLREYTLLGLFLRHPRQVLERELILSHVWGYDFEGSSNVVDVYIEYLRSKLEAQGGKRLIQTVRGVGYVLREPEEESYLSLQSH